MSAQHLLGMGNSCLQGLTGVLQVCSGRGCGSLLQGLGGFRQIGYLRREALQPTRVGMEIASALFRLHGDQFDVKTSERLVGTPTPLARAKAGDDPAAIVASWAEAEAAWRRLRAKYLLYR